MLNLGEALTKRSRRISRRRRHVRRAVFAFGVATRCKWEIFDVHKRAHETFHIYEQFDTRPNESSFALSQIRQHGTPFVLIVDRNGGVRRSDRRSGCRELIEEIAPMRGDRLPEVLARVVRDHSATPPAGDAATVTVAGTEIVVSVVSLDGTDELFAFWIWRFRKDRALETARRRYVLTNRECELLDRILRGESSAEIGRALSISLATVEWHTKRLLLKTNSQNRTQMATRVLGWLPDAS